MRNRLCHGLHNARCMMMRNRDLVQSQAQPVEKSGDSELSLLFSTKFGSMKQTDSNYLIIMKHDGEISSRAMTRSIYLPY